MNESKSKLIKTLFIADDHRIFANGLKQMLSESENYKVIGYELNGAKVVSSLIASKPDILLLDLNMPDKDGLQILQEIRKVDKELKVVVLTMYNDVLLVDKIKNLGGNAYLLKSAEQDELLDCLDSLDYNDFFVGKSVKSSTKLHQAFSDKFAGKIRLTQREIEIVGLIIQGNTTSKISDKLFISTNTIETHRKNIFKKLQVKSLTELIHFAYENELI